MNDYKMLQQRKLFNTNEYVKAKPALKYGGRLVIGNKKEPLVDSILAEEPKIIGGIDNKKQYLIQLWKGSASYR